MRLIKPMQCAVVSVALVVAVAARRRGGERTRVEPAGADRERGREDDQRPRADE